jgi:two-component system, chemotaxis family, chemotaxis protein CheY
MRALIVDDSRSIRTIVGRILKEIGFTAVEASNGKDALRVLGELPADLRPTLALLDWNMPEMNGLELLQALRADERYAQMTVLMVTTEAELGQMSRAIAAGANEYVTKPFTKEILGDKLAMVGIDVGVGAQ